MPTTEIEILGSRKVKEGGDPGFAIIFREDGEEDAQEIQFIIGTTGLRIQSNVSKERVVQVFTAFMNTGREGIPMKEAQA